MCHHGLTKVRRARAFVLDSYDGKHVSDWVDCNAVRWAATTKRCGQLCLTPAFLPCHLF
jgi:hypothetical protein